MESLTCPLAGMPDNQSAMLLAMKAVVLNKRFVDRGVGVRVSGSACERMDDRSSRG